MAAQNKKQMIVSTPLSRAFRFLLLGAVFALPFGGFSVSAAQNTLSDIGFSAKFVVPELTTPVRQIAKLPSGVLVERTFAAPVFALNTAKNWVRLAKTEAISFQDGIVLQTTDGERAVPLSAHSKLFVAFFLTHSLLALAMPKIFLFVAIYGTITGFLWAVIAHLWRKTAIQAVFSWFLYRKSMLKAVAIAIGGVFSFLNAKILLCRVSA